jgi:hypothetical protein
MGHGMRNRVLSTGTFARAYHADRKAAIEALIDADPVAACVREIMTERNSWSGSAADLLRTGWPKNPRALAGRFRKRTPRPPSLS